MSSALFSHSWYRVASLQPRLRTQARVVRHLYRGERWWILQDRASGHFLRLNTVAYGVLALCDGRRTLEEIWQFLSNRDGDNAPTQDEILQLLNQLHQANLLHSNRPADLQDLGERRENVRWRKIKQYINNPLSFKIALFDPDRLLTLLSRLLPRPWLGALLLLWLILVGSGMLQAALHWQELTNDLTAQVFTPENMLLLWMAFPILKAVHELGHGLAVKILGGSCHETGLMFLVMVPVPYVDVSDSTALSSKYQRMLVGAAGMMAELSVAAVAVWLWSWSMPGPGRAFLHQVIVLAGMTTLLFNMNPLIRFDGYYIFADWLEIPNLAQKANRYLGYLLHRYAFGNTLTFPPPMSKGETPWLLGFALAAFVYRILLSIGIILLIAESYFFIGVLMALWATWSMVLLPIAKQLHNLLTNNELEGKGVRVTLALSLLAGSLLGPLLTWPVADWTMSEGVVWMPEESRLRAAVSCMGEQVLVPSGSPVEKATPLLRCSDPELAAQVAQLQAKQAEIEARLSQAQNADRVQRQIIQTELEQAKSQLEDAQQRQESLIVHSPHAGTFIVPEPGDYPGRFLRRGDVVAYLLDPARFTLLTVVPQGEVDLVRRQTRAVELRSVDRVWELIPATIVREVPAATNELPSMALSLAGGGTIGLDPSARQEAKAITSLFHFELAFAEQKVPTALGNRVYVRFVHHDLPLAWQWYRGIRQMFLKRFAV
ncbi:PqqD family peptide modification chaperone [Candidatus Magnetaquicoccus inordinatus]|uniref:PqqD family peptide modification chaperone n=1 Tax=Candidatus Magnetaquicoccus inordinatus TaxID=2496818 RepID=UPI00102C5382|nr:PqqD family peptide modification chaperone [Candidatus Magnetaquicoccus inordinatus]